MPTIDQIDGIGEERAEVLRAAGVETVADLHEADTAGLTEIEGIGENLATEFKLKAAEAVGGGEQPGETIGDQPVGDRLPARREEPLELAPDNHRYLLDVYNRAVLPEELEDLPVPDIRPEAPRDLIRYRDRYYPYGFTHIDQLIEPEFIDPDRIPDINTAITQSTGSWTTMTPSLPQKLLNECSTFQPGHAALLKTGEVLILPSEDCEETVIYDPTQNQYRRPGNQPTDVLYCSGHTFLADGKLLVVGGGGGSSGDAIKSAWVFDPDDQMNSRQGVWKKVRKSTGGQVEKMNRARWYPTCVTLGGGRVLIAGGDHTTGQQKDLELYDYDVTDGQIGQFSTIGISNPSQHDRDLKEYPGLHLLPNNGEIFHSRADWDPISGTKNATFRFTSGYSTGEWTDLADTMDYPDRKDAMSVQLLEKSPSGDWIVKILVVGGGPTSARDTAEIINLSQQTPQWNNGNPATQLTKPRKQGNVVLLPTGSAFVCGGIESAHAPYTSALFDPDTGSWSQMAPIKQERTHHSAALLLRSGEVMITGGDHAADPNSIEVFQPPYMQGGGRPSINASSVPGTVHHGSTFTITSPQAGNIQETVLVRPMAVTHFTDTEQRVIPMEFTQSGNTLTITAPNNNHPHPVAPRGQYMLFVLDGTGAPSEGEFVFLH